MAKPRNPKRSKKDSTKKETSLRQRKHYKLTILPPDAPARVDGHAAELKRILAALSDPNIDVNHVIANMIESKRVQSILPTFDPSLGIEIRTITQDHILQEFQNSRAQVRERVTKYLAGLYEPIRRAERNSRRVKIARNQIARIAGEAEAGEESAARLLYSIATQCIDAIDKLTATQLDFVKTLSRKVLLWPSMIGPLALQSEKNANKMKALEIGTSISLLKLRQIDARICNKEKDQYKHITEDLVFWCLERIEDVRLLDRLAQRLSRGYEQCKSLCLALLPSSDFYEACCSLPDLTAAEGTFDAWYPAVQKLIDFVYDGKPENDDSLAAVGGARQNPGKAKERIRSAIWDAVRETLHEIIDDASAPR